MDFNENLNELITNEIASLGVTKFTIALSGGVDSMVLLDLLSKAKRSSDVIKAIHINHNLHETSKEWVDFVTDACKKYKLPLIIESINPKQEGFGLEAEAREQRYKKFKEIILDNECLLTAHHLDDQIETMLFRIFRGTGLDGLRSIRKKAKFGKGLLCRPLINIPREAIEQYAKLNDIKWIEDPSNKNIDFDRNYLRNNIVPSIKKRWPNAQKTITRLSSLAENNQKLLHELAKEDIGEIEKFNVLDIGILSNKSSLRINNIFRFMILKNKMGIPSLKVLENGIETLINAKSDSPIITWDGFSIRRYKNTLYFFNPDLKQDEIRPLKMKWFIDETINLGGNRGSIQARFIKGQGIALNKCPKSLEIKYRKGGEQIKPSGHKITKSLKNLFQENNVLPWVRDQIPLFYLDEELVSVGDLWFNQDYKAKEQEDGFLISWDRNIDIIHNS